MTYEEGFSELVDPTIGREERLARLSQIHTPEEATIIDDTFAKAMREVLSVMGRTLDELSLDLARKASDYMLQGILINLQAMSNAILERQLQNALENGDILIVAGGSSDCTCEACTARRLSQAALNGTVH